MAISLMNLDNLWLPEKEILEYFQFSRSFFQRKIKPRVNWKKVGKILYNAQEVWDACESGSGSLTSEEHYITPVESETGSTSYDDEINEIMKEKPDA
ncbi:hypothetical protein ACFL35_03960 [Candidatus Riflebacteria bacterium]